MQLGGRAPRGAAGRAYSAPRPIARFKDTGVGPQGKGRVIGRQ